MRWSIIVCTHNRAQCLRENLPRLGLLDYPNDGYEIIVVDNASTDDTAEVVKIAGPDLIYIYEETPGLSRARNRGIDTAKGDFIAFIDDDAWPEPNWLQELEIPFAESGVACAGGKVIPAWESGRRDWPQWIHPILYAQFSVTGYGDIAHKTNYPRIPSGTNIAFRKSVLALIGGFRPDLGRFGSCLISGEEGEMCLRLEQAGYEVEYVPQAVVHHQISELRLTKKWLLDRSHWQGISSAIIANVTFTRGALFFSVVRCRALMAAAHVLAPVAMAFGNERLAFLCTCQKVLWRAYLLKAGLKEQEDR